MVDLSGILFFSILAFGRSEERCGPIPPPTCAISPTSEVLTSPLRNPSKFLQDAIKNECGAATQSRDCIANFCFHKKYRSSDGVCNNFKNPTKGAAYTTNPRLLPSNYDDGIGALTGSLKNRRPNVRLVTTRLLRTPQAINLNVSSMFMQFAQFISHDITQNAVGFFNCNCSEQKPQCANVPEVTINNIAFPCVAFERSLPVCGTGVNGKPREMMNVITAFIDGGGLYGNDEVTSSSLRSGALLQTSIINGRSHAPNPFRAGDFRNNVFSGILAIQTIFLRFHNTIAAQLKKLNSHWSDDRVFQETRKIIGATLQVIVYKEFLPALLGPKGSRLVPPYDGYKPDVDPSIINEFTSAANRLHGMIHESYPLIDEHFKETGRYSFREGVFDENNITRNHLDLVLRGLIGTPARAAQRLSTNIAHGVFNLAIMGLQRGRDNGIRPYNDYRVHCGLPRIASFDSWSEVKDPSVIAVVKELYSNGVDTMDLYTAGIMEEPRDGSVMGPTFSCIIAEQFKRIRDGDRFYFENPGVFTSDQVIALRRVTLSWIMCSNGDGIDRITAQSLFTDKGEHAVACSSMQSLDLKVWKERN